MAEDTLGNKHMINTDRVFDYVNQVSSECLKAFSLGAKPEKNASLELQSSGLVCS